MTVATLQDVLREDVGDLGAAVLGHPDVQGTVLKALDETGKWHRRRCELPAPLMLAAVILMSLYRPLSIVNVFKRVLDVARKDSDHSLKGVTAETFYHARARLGPEPLRSVARELARETPPSPSFLGLVPMAIDGVKLNLPDTEENEKELGRPRAARGETASPQMTGVGLIYAETRQAADFVWGPWNLSEPDAAERLLPNLGPGHVVFLDRRCGRSTVPERRALLHNCARWTANVRPDGGAAAPFQKSQPEAHHPTHATPDPLIRSPRPGVTGLRPVAVRRPCSQDTFRLQDRGGAIHRRFGAERHDATSRRRAAPWCSA